MPKQLNINLAMTADTSQAKSQLQQLQQQLNDLTKIQSKSSDFGFTKEIQNATAAAARLQVQLKSATDVDTGRLDLTKFTQSMLKSGMSLEKYQKQLRTLGPEGDKAFAQLATSISNADVRIRNANTLLGQFATTLKNTARWQISSSLLHSFMGTLQSAYGYAQDLNQSLNNIRIVTGASVDEMSAFADRANKAAQALNTSTTQYTDAALIYYQQGIRDQEEIAGRTETTIKLANVSRQSAEETSDQLTAIWNNFYDGSKSLEYYADVITALGAATASSSEEISTGLQKFAAVADTVGLSYEYATSALATITATTRQSADTVGTGLRTLFTRLQGLKLGETLDDGTDLNKYSKALETVGVQILDVNGEMKDMDTILDELGARWGDLSKAQQTALAQTVGGVRQYTNLIALMDNWDFMKENLEVAQGAEGTLQEQADIYAESWEAAQKRVKASAQEIYGALLDDKFFIAMNNGLANFLQEIGNIIDSLGGLKGVLLLIGTLVTRIFEKEITVGIANAIQGLRGLTAKGRQEAEAQRTEANDLLINNAYNDGTDSGAAIARTYEQQGTLQKTLIENAGLLNEEEKNIAQVLLDQNKALGEQIRNKATNLKQLQDEAAAEKHIFELKNKGILSNPTYKKNYDNMAKQASRVGGQEEIIKTMATSGDAISQFKEADTKSEKNISTLKELYSQISSVQRGYVELGKTAQEALGTKAGNALDAMASAFNEDGTLIEGKLKELQQGWQNFSEAFLSESGKLDTNISLLAQKISGAPVGSEKYEQVKATLQALAAQFQETGAEATGMAGKMGQAAQGASQISTFFNEIGKTSNVMITGFTKMASSMMTVGMAISSVTSMIRILNDEESTTAEKITTVLTTLGMVAPALGVVKTAFSTATVAETLFGEAGVAAGTAIQLSMWQLTLILGTVALVIAGIVAATKAAYAASPEGKLEAAEEEAKAMSEALDEARSKADELHSAFDEYESIVDKLNKCTKGTQEWRDALEEANQKTTELLQKYPELLKEENLFDENGILNPEVLEKAVEKADNAQNAIAAANIMAQAKVNSAQVEVNKKQFAHQGDERYEIQGPKGETYTDYAKANADLQKLLEQYPALGSSALELSDAYAVLGIDMANATEEEQALANSLLELANASIQAGTAVDNATKSIINDWAEANNVELEEGQAEIMGQAYEKEYDRIKQMIIDADASANSRASKSDNSSVAELDNKSVWELYNEAMGTNYRLSSNGIQGNDNNRTYEYIDDEHNKHTVTIDEIADIIAASQALEGMGTAAEDAQKALSNMAENVGEDIASGLQKWIATGNFESMTQEDFQKMTAGMDKDDDGNYNRDDVEAYLEQALGTDDVASILGDDWYENFNTAAVDFETAIDSITDHLSDSAKTIYENISGIDKLSLGAQQSVAKMIQDTFNAQGSEVASALGEKINSVLSDENISDEDKEKFISTLNSITWDTASIGEFKTALQNAGIDLSKFGLDAEELFNMLSTAGSASIETLRDQYKEVQDIIKGLKTGDTIEDTDYQKLVAQYGAEAMDVYFETMADGTHRLIQDADDFYAHITNASRQAMLNNITEGRDVNNTLQNSSAEDLNSGEIDDSNTALAAMTYLDTLDLEEEKLNQLAEAREHYNQIGEFTAEDLQLINELMQENKISAEDYENMMKQTMETMQQNAEAYLSTATSVSELDALDAQLKAEGINASIEYSEALIGLAGQYENTAEEIEKYQLALQSGNEEQITAAEDALKAATKLGEAAEKYDLNARSLEAQAKEIADAQGISAEEAANLAVANQRLNKGVTQLNKNWKNWKKTLTTTDKTSQDYADTLVDLSDSVADIVGWYKELNLSSKFVEKNMDLIEQAASGDTTAILELGAAVAQAEIAEAELNTTIKDGPFASGRESLFGKLVADAGDAQTAFDQLKGNLSDTFGLIQSKMGELQNGASLQDVLGGPEGLAGFVTQLNQYAEATGMTADQMQAMLTSIGVQANVETDYKAQEVTVPTYDEYSTLGEVEYVDLPAATSDGQVATSRVPVWHKTNYTVMGPPMKTDGFVEVASISMEEGKGAPKFVGRQAPSSSSTGGGGGGGGRGRRGRRGSGRRAAEKKSKVEIDEKEYKKEDKEIERYHEIKNTLETIGYNLDKIAQKKDKAFGKAKIQAIREETKELEKQIAAQKQYIKEIKDNYSKDKSALAAFGATFNADDEINNYDELMQARIDEYNRNYEKFIAAQNAAVTKFNNSKRGEADEKTYDAEIKAAEKQWERDQEKYSEFEEALKQYEETYDLLYDAELKLQESIDQHLQDLLDAIDLEVTLNVEVDDKSIAILQDLLEGLGDSADVAADAIVNYGNQMDKAVDKAERYKKGIADILTTFGASDALIERAMNNALTQADLDFLEAAGISESGVELLQSYTDGLLDVNSEVRSLTDNAIDRLSEAFSEYTDELDRNSEAIEHLQKVNETYKNIIDIVGKKVLDSSGDLTKTLNKTNWELQRNNTHALKSEMEFIAKAREDLEKEINALRGKNDAESQRILHQLEEQLKEETDKYTETYEAWLDSWEAELQGAADMYAETLEDIVRNFEDSIAGAMGSMTELQEAFDRKKEIDDVYLDDYEKIYQLSKLNRDINNSIDDTDNIKSKQALKKLLGEIEQLQEDGVELSEYDVENARRRYELALALQQLEEAQDAKSKVRMRRDSEGNYGYVYTADANAVADAEQNYEDKLYQMQKANADYIDDLQSNIIQAQENCSAALAELNAADFASYEEYQAAAQEIRDHYQELINDYFQQLGGALDNNRELYTVDWAEYSAATGYKISADNAYVDNFNETVYAILTGFETMEDAQLAFASASSDTLNDMALAWYEWYEQTQISLSDGETSIEDYADTVNQKTEELEEYGDRLEESAANMADSYITAYDNILDKLREFLLNYTNSVESIISLDSRLSSSINQVTAALTGYNEASASASSDSDSSSSSSSSSSGSSSSSSRGRTSSSKRTSSSRRRTTSSRRSSSSGGWRGKTYTVRSGDTMYGIGAKLGVNARKLWDHNKSHMRSNNWNLIYPGEKIYYDTGGYTGSWGPEGKLAFLHQKELVLNADDTKNFLAGMDILRQISDAIDLNALVASSSLSSGLNSEVKTSSNDGTLQQMVTITAEFKDATTANEITAAFDNLINRASQFANRKN